MRTSADMLDALNEIERRFPVDEWRAGDIDLWPTYRIRLYGLAIDAALYSDARGKGRLKRWAELAARAARSRARVPLARLRDRASESRIRPETSALFLSDGVSFAKIDGRWFDRIEDPVILAMQRRGLQVLKLTPMSNALTPRATPSIFIQPAIDRLKLTATRIAEHRLAVPAFDQARALAVSHFGDAPTLAWLSQQAGRLDALARWFGKILAHSGARTAFVNTFYALEGLALIQAARRAGIRSVDLQHGMQGDSHVGYSRWARVPELGYSTIPDEFWVWSEVEARHIDAWSELLPTHRPVVTGNPWLEAWLEPAEPALVREIERAHALRSGVSSRHILACLSWGIDREETDKLLRAAKLTGSGTIWWWRLHPVEADRCGPFAAELAAHGLDGSRVREATDLPLPALIQASDVVVAHSSTVIAEAADFGVPSIVTSEYGAALHAGLVQQGIATKAITDQDIAAAVVGACGKRRSTNVQPAEDQLERAISGLQGS